MQRSQIILYTPGIYRRGLARAFSIMELMVAIAILIVIILSVAVIFNGASKSVSNSTALMETLSGVRGVQQQVERLVSRMDKNGFLVIRSQLLYPTKPVAGGPLLNSVTSPRFDQIAFLANDTFPNRTGADTVRPFADASTSNAAHVWIGQLVMERNDPPNTSFNSLRTLSGGKTSVNQALPPLINQFPTGVVVTNPQAYVENDCTLGIHTTLMVQAQWMDADLTTIQLNGQNVKAYPSVVYDAFNNNSPPESRMKGLATDTVPAHITSSRVAIANETPSQLMSIIASDPAMDTKWPLLCYRFKALWSIYDTDEVNNLPFVNGYFRTHPVALRGLSSFKIEWQDVNGDWHDYNNPVVGGTIPKNSDYTHPAFGGIPSEGGDNYRAVFSSTFGNQGRAWPRALKFTYHVVDPNNRLQGGRDFTQVVRLPD